MIGKVLILFLSHQLYPILIYIYYLLKSLVNIYGKRFILLSNSNNFYLL